MGGNVFIHSHKVLRLNKKDYERYCIEIISLFNLFSLKENIDYKIVKAIREKETFGDMDIVIKNSIPLTLLKEKLIEYGYPVSKNGNVVSFLYCSFQIDLIFVNDDIFDYAWNYFNWNDVGNIIGRLSKQYGLKHGWQGLYYVQRNGDHIIKEHLLSTNYLDVLNCMHLNTDTFLNGFDTFEKMFSWVTSSTRFMPEIFKFENLNHTNRVRDKKRKTYNMFLKYLETIDQTQFEENFKLTSEEKTECVCRWFPFVRSEIEKYDKINKEIALTKNKFNGLIIHNLLDIKGKVLGNFITQFKSIYNNGWINNTDQKIINQTIIDFYKNNFKVD